MKIKNRLSHGFRNTGKRCQSVLGIGSTAVMQLQEYG